MRAASNERANVKLNGVGVGDSARPRDDEAVISWFGVVPSPIAEVIANFLEKRGRRGLGQRSR